MEKPKKRLLVLVREATRRKHYSKRTEEAYIYWIKRYIFFHNKRHPLEMSNAEVEAFLTDLATKRLVSASTQNQAFSALLFLYREVLNKPLEGPIDSLRAKRPKRLPTVLTREETLRVIERISGVHQLKQNSCTEAVCGFPNALNYVLRILTSHSTRLLSETPKVCRIE